MSTRLGRQVIGRSDVSLCALLLPLWAYAAVLGVLAAGAGELYGSAVTVAVVVVGGAGYPAVSGWLRRITRSRR